MNLFLIGDERVQRQTDRRKFSYDDNMAYIWISYSLLNVNSHC
jgi:hypothetical protein